MTKQFLRMTTTLGLRFGPVRKGVTPKRILEYILQDMVRLLDDTALTTDSELIAQTKGMQTAYRNVAHFIAPLTDVSNGNNVPQSMRIGR